jgi:hypothetical protein
MSQAAPIGPSGNSETLIRKRDKSGSTSVTQIHVELKLPNSLRVEEEIRIESPLRSPLSLELEVREEIITFLANSDNLRTTTASERSSTDEPAPLAASPALSNNTHAKHIQVSNTCVPISGSTPDVKSDRATDGSNGTAPSPRIVIFFFFFPATLYCILFPTPF